MASIRCGTKLTKIGLALVVVTAACGDDGVVAGDTDDETSSTGGMADDSPTPDATGSDAGSDSTDDGMVDDSSTGMGPGSTTADDTGAGSESSTGEPNTDPSARNDTYLVVFEAGQLVVDVAEGVLANDDDADGDVVTVEAFDAASVAGGTVDMAPDGSFTYTPPVDFFGEDELGYTISDGAGGSASARVRVNVAPTTMELELVTGGVAGFAIDGETAGDEAGRAAALVGDVNGDGLDDVLVGAPEVSAGDGRAYVVFGKTDGTAVSLASVASGVGGFAIDGGVGEGAGAAVDGAGDVDGDGLADVIVGAPSAEAGAGRAYVIFGKDDGDPVALVDIAAGSGGGFVLLAGIPGIAAGSSVAGAGDVDGDGLGDVLVGAPLAGASTQGAAYLVFGTGDTLPITLSMLAVGGEGFAMTGAVVQDEAGRVVAGLGDVNADGLADIGVGAPQANPNGGNSGEVYVVFGKTGTAPVALGSLGASGFVIRGEAGIDLAGTSIDGVGDLDGDGRSDIVVGAPGAQNDLDFQGRAYLVRGKSTTTAVELATIATGTGGFVIDGQSQGDFAAISVAGLGDVDADGFADFAVGSVNGDYAGTNSGRTYVVWGKNNGTPVALADTTLGQGGFALDGEVAQDESAWCVAGGGDVDADGHGDLVIAGPGHAADAGRVWVVFGGDYRGRVTHFGSTGDDDLLGTAGPDVFVTDDGYDIMRGEGGADVFYGGRSDDFVDLSSAQFFRIDGGSGIDTLRLAGADITLDLGLVPNQALRAIEIVDLTGSGGNAIILDRFDVLNMVGAAHTLLVLGDGDDTVEADLSGGTWAATSVIDGVVWWSDGVSAFGVAEAVVADVTL
jgi:hypothetical protein